MAVDTILKYFENAFKWIGGAITFWMKLYQRTTSNRITRFLGYMIGMVIYILC